MALIDVATATGKFYSVTRFEIVRGQDFQLFLTPDKEGKTRWFWEHDKVLDTEVENYTAKVKAADIGDATLYIYQGDGRGDIIMEVNIKVVERIEAPAVKLVGEVGENRPKRV